MCVCVLRGAKDMAMNGCVPVSAYVFIRRNRNKLTGGFLHLRSEIGLNGAERKEVNCLCMRACGPRLLGFLAKAFSRTDPHRIVVMSGLANTGRWEGFRARLLQAGEKLTQTCSEKCGMQERSEKI